MRVLLLAPLLALTLFSCSTSKKAPAKPSTIVQAPKSDSSKSTMGAQAAKPGTPKPFSEVITAKAQSQKGMFNIHKVDDKYYFEIGDTLMGREILTVNRISKAGAGMRLGFFGYAGDQVGQNVIRFERGPNNKVFLRTISYEEYAKDSTSPMYNTVMNSNVQPISAAFDIKALSKDSKGVVIDATDFISGDNDVTGFGSVFKTALRIGSLQNDKSYIVSVKSFPINIEAKTVKTYTRSSGSSIPGMMPSAPAGGNVTIEMNSSMVLLPAKPMQARYFDPRVGYFTVGYTDFDLDPQGVKRISLIKRWRLEPKPEDEEKYTRGELVEPQKPIVFYIDPATPKKWVPFLLQGVNDWQSAFEKAGFKNAIMAKLAPKGTQDSTWSLDDARNSAIVYKPSDIPNASGPSISDPRSGEIMESHINWYHNVMSLLRNWYLIQAANSDRRARKMTFDDELMGQLIRFVSSHEVGHTLGLRHNFGSSSTVPVEKLRDKNWVEDNGHTPSIMDYARFNYIAQPEDNISEKGLFPRIGDYDNWAIEWGYRRFLQYKSPDAEKSHLNKWVIEKLKNKRLWFGTEINPDDPRSQSEDLGDNSMKSSFYGIKNLQRILPNLAAWTRQDNEDYTNLDKLYGEVVGQYSRYMGHVAKNVAGIFETPKMVEETGTVYEYVSKTQQKEAVDFLNAQLFATPMWLADKNVIAQTGENPLATIGNVQDFILKRLINDRTFIKMSDNESLNGSTAYKSSELLADLKKGIFTEIASGKSIDVYRRNLQKSFVNILADYISPAKNTPPSINIPGIVIISTASIGDKYDGKSVARAFLSDLKNELGAASNRTADQMTKYHLKDLVYRIGRALDPK